jgi:hypothetical protein
MKNIQTIIRSSLLILSFFAISVFAEDPILTIQSGTTIKKFTLTQLLKIAAKIEIQNDPAYPGKKINYQAVRVKTLFKDIEFQKGATLLFKCTDGFSAPISHERLLNQSQDEAIPYIA